MSSMRSPRSAASWAWAQAAAGNGIFVVGDRRPKTCLRDERPMRRDARAALTAREKPAETEPFRRQVFHGKFRWTGWWWTLSSANQSPTRLRELTGQIREFPPF